MHQHNESPGSGDRSLENLQRVEIAELLRAREQFEIEWWYYSGHLQAGPRSFGFCAAFFRGHTARNDTHLLLRPIVRRVFPEQYCPAHFSFTDWENGEFHYAHRRPVGGQAGAASDRYHAWCGDWSAAEDQGLHTVHLTMQAANLDLTLTPQKPWVVHGRDGWVEKGCGRKGFHASLPRMAASGQLELNGERSPVAGTVWMDREFGNWWLNQELWGWDWFAVQLDSGEDLMVSAIRDQQMRLSPLAFLTFVGQNGDAKRLSSSEFTIVPHDTWVSPWSDARYPSGWTLRAAEPDLELRIEPHLRCQEIDSRGSTMVIYWEGAAAVRGRFDGRNVQGCAYVELFGYDDTHRHVSPLDWLWGEWLVRRLGKGRTRREAECRGGLLRE